MSSSCGSLVVSRCSARPGRISPRRTPDGCCTAFQSSIVAPSERPTTSTLETTGAAAIGHEPVDDHGDRQREHGEVRPAARREAARAGGAVPGADEAAPLDGGDRAVLGAVQPKGSAPHQPGDEHCRTHEPDRQLERRREERQQRRGQDHRGEEDQALTAARDTGPPCQRPQRRRKLEQAAENRDPARPRRRRAHRPLVQLTVGRRERPVALADDDDAVRPGHPAEPRERRRGIGTREDLESGGVVHAHTVPHAQPPGKCRAA